MRSGAQLFEQVGRMDDDDAGWRRAVSLAVTGALAGVAGIGVLLGGSAFAVIDAGGPAIDGEVMVLLEAPAAEGPLSPLPSLPPAPPPPAPAQAAARASGDADPGAEPAAEPAPSAGAAGTAGDGEADGTAPNAAGAGLASRAVVRTMVQPEYPQAARALGLATQRCTARVEVDVDGAPDRVDVDGCPEVFHRATREGVLRWRWYPPRVLGVPSRAVVTVAVTYRLSDVPAGDAG